MEGGASGGKRVGTSAHVTAAEAKRYFPARRGDDQLEGRRTAAPRCLQSARTSHAAGTPPPAPPPTCSPSRLRTRLSATYACPSAKQSLSETRARSRVRPWGREEGGQRVAGRMWLAGALLPKAINRSRDPRKAKPLRDPLSGCQSMATWDLCTVIAQASLRGIWVRVQEPTPASSALNTVGPAQRAQQAGAWAEAGG